MCYFHYLSNRLGSLVFDVEPTDSCNGFPNPFRFLVGLRDAFDLLQVSHKGVAGFKEFALRNNANEFVQQSPIVFESLKSQDTISGSIEGEQRIQLVHVGHRITKLEPKAIHLDDILTAPLKFSLG